MSLSRRRSTAVLAALGTAAAAVTAVLLTGGSPAGAAPGCSEEPSFDVTIPAPAGAPAATTLSDGSVGYAALGADKQVYFVNSDITVDPLLIAPLACLKGNATDNLAVVETPASLTFIVRGPDGRISQNDVTEAAPNGAGWEQLPYGATTNGPAALANADGSISLFVRGTNGALFLATRNADGGWSQFRSLGGGFVGTPTVAAKPGGGALVVVRNSAGLLYSKASSSTGVWSSAWTKLPGAAAGSPTLTAGYAAGRLDLFVIGNRGGLYQSAYTAGKFGAFRGIEFASTRARVAAAATAGRIIVYVRDDFGNGTFETAYTQYIPGGWTGDRTEFDYLLAPYTCDECGPDDSTALARSAGKVTRPARAVPAGK